MTKLIKDWGITLLVIGVLYFTGWHKVVISKVQELVLSTGIIKPSISENEAIGQANLTASNFILENTTGNRLTGDELKGKVLFINFWATWCPPCLAEMPAINSLYRKIDTTKVKFLMIEVDGNLSKAKELVTNQQLNFPVYKQLIVPPEFQTNSLPTTFIIGKKGKIWVKHKGMASYDNEKIRSLLEKLSSK